MSLHVYLYQSMNILRKTVDLKFNFNGWQEDESTLTKLLRMGQNLYTVKNSFLLFKNLKERYENMGIDIMSLIPTEICINEEL